jgi:hypothetical protein
LAAGAVCHGWLGDLSGQAVDNSLGMLKVDTATKGYYTKRLFLGVPLGIIGYFVLYDVG